MDDRLSDLAEPGLGHGRHEVESARPVAGCWTGPEEVRPSCSTRISSKVQRPEDGIELVCSALRCSCDEPGEA